MNETIIKDKHSDGFTVLQQPIEKPEEYFYGTVLPLSIFETRFFVRGARVRIKKDSEHAYQNGGLGIITGWHQDSPANAEVCFEDGYKNYYFVGSEIAKCELELVQDLCMILVLDGTEIGRTVKCSNPCNLKIRAGHIVKISAVTKEIIDYTVFTK